MRLVAPHRNTGASFWNMERRVSLAGIPARVFSGFRVGARNDVCVTPHRDAGSRREPFGIFVG